MILPCSTNRESVTSFSMRLFTLVAMALVAAGGRNYEVNDEKEHHGKLALISLDGDALQEKINYMGFEGNNSSWETAERGSMALGCEGAQRMEAGDGLRVQGREACEKRECDLRGREVRGFMDMEKIKVQVLGNKNSFNASEEVEGADAHSLPGILC